MSASDAGGGAGVSVTSIKALQAALAVLKDTKSAGTQQRETVALKTCRQGICQQVNERLTDLTKVAAELAKNGVSQGVVILNFLQFCTTHYPQVYVNLRYPQPHPQSPPPRNVEGLPGLSQTAAAESRPAESQDNEYHVCKGYLTWLLSRLLWILAEEDCEQIHDQTRKLVVSLLQAAKFKFMPLFHELMTEVCQLIAECACVSSNRFKNGNIQELSMPVILPHFTVDETKLRDIPEAKELSLIYTSPKPLTLQYYSHCHLLQVALSQVLSTMSIDICYMMRDKHALIWQTLGVQIEEGHLALKQISLEVVGNMLQHHHIGLPPAVTFDYLYDLFIVLFNFIVSSQEQCQQYKDVAGLERALAMCLQQVFAITEGKPIYSLAPSLVNQMMETLSNDLTQYGLQNLKTDELKAMVCHIIYFIYRHVPVGYESISNVRKTRRSLINAALCDHLSKTSHTSYVIPPLCQAIANELDSYKANKALSATSGSLAQGEASNATTTTDASSSSGDERPEKRRRLSLHRTPRAQKTRESIDRRNIAEEDSTAVIDRSSTLRAVVERVEYLGQQIKSDDTDNMLHTLEGIQVGLEVLLHSFAAWVDKSGNQHPNSATAPNMTPRTPGRKSQDKCGFYLWLRLDQIKELCSVWKHTLLMLAGDDQEAVVDKEYIRILRSIGSLLAITDVVHFPASVTHQLTWMISLPWLPMDSNWLDLKVHGEPSAKDVAQLSSDIADKIDPATQAQCMEVASLFLREATPKWRTHLFRAAMGSSHDVVRKGAVKAFSIFLHNMGPNYHHLIQDIIHDMVKDDSRLVQEQLAKAMGPIACIVCRTASCKRVLEPAQFKHLHETLRITCSGCDVNLSSTVQESNKKAARNDGLDPSLVAPFLYLINGGKAVKLALIQSFQQVFNHLDLQSPNGAVTNVLNSCLVIIEDPDFEVRLAFSKQIKYLVGCGVRSNSTNDQAVVGRLKSAFMQAKTNGNAKLQETIVETIGQLGQVADGELLLVAIVILLESRQSTKPVVCSAAIMQLREIARVKGVSLQSLFQRFKKPISEFMMGVLHKVQSMPGIKTTLGIITETANAFQFRDVKAFLEMSLKFTLPYIVSRASAEDTSSILRVMSKTVNMGHKKMLIDNFKYIFSYLARNCNKQEQDRALQYIQSETDIELGSLIRSEILSLHNELLLHLSTNYSRVFNGLAILANKDDHWQGSNPITETKDMADFLQPRLLGILAFFDSHLLNSQIDVDDKKLAMESLVCIMRLMGTKHITQVRMKVMTTLKIGLQYKEHGFPVLSCRAWKCFVQSVDPSSLGPMFSQVIVTLLPLLNQLPEEVSKIYQYLIVEHRDSFSEYFHELYFMPDLTELKDVNAVLKEHRDDPTSQPDLHTQLKQSLRGVTHESVDVRRHALSKLRDLLHKNQDALHEFVMGSETVDPIVEQLVAVLLSGCRDSDPTAQSLFGECIGEMGAIDPGRLEIITSNKKEDLSKFHTTVEDTNFAFDLISELSRAFLAATDTRTQDCAAYAMQEVLQIYGCRDSGKDSAGRRLWNRFPAHIQEILAPLQHTRYLAKEATSWATLSKPVYRSKHGNTYKDWVCTWSGYLVSKVKSDKASMVFKSCQALLKHDINTALFLLPHVLLHVLLDGKASDKNEIHAEVMAVLNHAEKVDGQSAAQIGHMSTQTVFSVLDYLTRWKRHRIQTIVAGIRTQQSKSSTVGSTRVIEDPEYQCVEGFLKCIPQDVLARASYKCKAYARSLMHFEAYISASPAHKQDLQQHLGFPQELYVALNEPDGVVGVSAIRKEEPTLREQIMEHESIGKLRDASACYERAIQLEADEVRHHKGLLQSLVDLGQLNSALIHVNGLLTERPDWTSQLNEYRVEACWKLARWDTLETYLKPEKHNTSNWNVGLGKILLAVKQRDGDQFEKHLKVIRRTQMGPLSAASMESGSYQRGYEFIARLHMLCDLEKAARCLVGLQRTTDDDSTQEYVSHSKLLSELDARLDMAQYSFRTQEPILCLRRILLGLNDSPEEQHKNKDIGHCWLKSAKVARLAGHLPTAYSSLLNAGLYQLRDLFIEKAKWLWSMGDGHQALITLQKGVEEHFSDTTRLTSDDEEAQAQKFAHAKALLMVGQFMEDTAKFESNSVMKQYKDVVEVNPQWENGHFHLAMYYDKVMQNVTDRPEKAGQFILHVINNFGQSLLHGNQYIYQSMPRMLSLWFDYGVHVSDLEKTKKTSAERMAVAKTMLMRINKIIHDLTDKLAPYQFLTAFSQLISRICHAHPDVFQKLQAIIARALVAFPQQAVWMSMAVSKSTYAMRKTRCAEIFERAKSLNKELNKFIQDATRLTDRLLELCNRPVDMSSHTLNISSDFRSLKRLLDDQNFSQIIVPLQSAMTVTLPTSAQGCASHRDHDPFPTACVFITGFDDYVEVLPSLQRPKKIGIQASDGKLYVMMCKPKDDLRKDNRLMEFNGIINKCLRKDAESRRRQLHIRTYAVIPLNEECGLIEWVPNTMGLRHILHKIYKERGIYTHGRDLKNIIPALNTPVDQKLAIYRNKLLPRYPAVFGDWFLKTFPDPTSWYLSRLAYARTSAVMSMVGYILGLGDRHGENILYCSTSGDCVHVDFNCLFNKGETFDWPERVPFRMTQNMVAAMGPMGCEGIFRKACEVTMKVMRDQREPLMSVLKTFIYDPLVEWSKPTTRSRATTSAVAESGEINNEKALTHVRDIDQRMQGILKNKNKTRGLPLSIEGHVHYLISEATSETNLCQMYVGWAAYM